MHFVYFSDGIAQEGQEDDNGVRRSTEMKREDQQWFWLVEDKVINSVPINKGCDIAPCISKDMVETLACIVERHFTSILKVRQNLRWYTSLRTILKSWCFRGDFKAEPVVRLVDW